MLWAGYEYSLNSQAGDRMSRRGRFNGSPISLFSFQDIITSVTAIMILLVLILTLELITRMSLKGVAAEDQKVARQLNESLETLRKRLKDLQSETADARDTAKRAAGQSVQDVDAERRKTQRNCERVKESLVSLQTNADEARLKRLDTERELVKVERRTPGSQLAEQKAAQDEARASGIETQNQEETKRQQQAEKELSESPAMVSTLVFNPPPGLLLKPVLAEVSSDGIAVMGDGATQVHNFGWGFQGPPTEFQKWLSGRTSSREYVVLMLRPSGLDRLDATRQAVLDAGLEVGLELVSEDMDIVLADSSTSKK
jgi:hypothetical protein